MVGSGMECEETGIDALKHGWRLFGDSVEREADGQVES